MGDVSKAVAYANNEVAFLSWELDGPIPGCLGFDLVRVYVDTGEKRGLAAFVPFKGQRNPDQKPQDTGVWPIQKTWWRDLTLRKRRDSAELRPDNVKVKYEIRPVGRMAPGLEAVPVRQPKAYTGDPIPLGYLGAGKTTNEILITSVYDDVSVAFTNGILAGQWLKRAIKSEGKPFNADTLRTEIADPDSNIRKYLTGDVLGFLRRLIERAAHEGGKVHLALYELADPELTDFLAANEAHIDLILSNTGQDTETRKWDLENRPIRDRLKADGAAIQNRLFNNGHIGHNKFAVYVDGGGVARAVMSGSTNWTSSGLCGQSNNALIVESDGVADAYLKYWQRLKADPIADPNPPDGPGHGNVQGKPLRIANQTPNASALKKGAVQLWYSPNTIRTTKDTSHIPPDLGALFPLIAGAKKAIFFLAFLPAQQGLFSIIDQAIKAGVADPELLVLGAVSNPRAMPNFQPTPHGAGGDGGEDDDDDAARSPFVFDQNRTHIVRATNLGSGTALGDFEREILTVGHAIVHDKIIIVDPLSADCVVATGSHNLGYKASYENDENLLIFKGNKALAQAYAVHALDVYDHYRYRAWQAQNKLDGQPLFEGNIDIDDQWLQPYLDGTKGDIARYFAGA